MFVWFAATPPPAVQRRRPLHRDQVCNKTGHHARAFDVLFENDELLRATFWDRKALKPTHVTYSLMLQARAPVAASRELKRQIHFIAPSIKIGSCGSPGA